MLTRLIFVSKSWLGSVTSCLALLILCQLAFGQMNERPRSERETSRNNATEDLSELAQENFSRVAASAIQIRQVLLKDAGLLVELKRWVAKEATDNGQVVEDSMLVDQAIFDRLDRDVAFRSVATRLLQRYGYLRPSPNPDSNLAKEEDLVLKERARRLVQIEEQEDSESLQPKKNDQELERTNACDPRQHDDCEKPNPEERRSNRPPETEAPIPETSPGLPPDISPQISSPRTLRTDLSNDGLPDVQREHSSLAEIELASNPGKPRTETPGFQSPP